MAYSERTSALSKINAISPIQVSKKNQSILSDLLADGNAATAADEILDSANFTKEEPEYEEQTYFTYSAVIENTSDVTFADFWIDINLVDEDGVVVETQEAYTENWTPGSKHRFDFSTDAEFKDIEVYSAQWTL